MTTFQSIISEAQPTKVESIKSSVIAAIIFIISSAVVGYNATFNFIINVTIIFIDWWMNLVNKVYDLTH